MYQGKEGNNYRDNFSQLFKKERKNVFYKNEQQKRDRKSIYANIYPPMLQLLHVRSINMYPLAFRDVILSFNNIFQGLKVCTSI